MRTHPAKLKCIHSFIHSFAPFIQSLFHACIHSLTHSLTRFLSQSIIQPWVHLFFHEGGVLLCRLGKYSKTTDVCPRYKSCVLATLQQEEQELYHKDSSSLSRIYILAHSMAHQPLAQRLICSTHHMTMKILLSCTIAYLLQQQKLSETSCSYNSHTRQQPRRACWLTCVVILFIL